MNKVRSTQCRLPCGNHHGTARFWRAGFRRHTLPLCVRYWRGKGYDVHTNISLGRTFTESVDVLCKYAAQKSFGCKKSQKVVRTCGFILEFDLASMRRIINVWKQSFGQCAKRLGISFEKSQVKNALGRRKAVLFQVVILRVCACVRRL